MRVAGRPTTAGRAATKRENKELNGQRKGKEEERRTRRATLCLRRGLLARGTVVVQAELSRGGEAKLQVELDVEVGAVGEGLPPAVTGNRRLGHTCYLQGGGTAATERVAGVLVGGGGGSLAPSGERDG